MPSRMKKNGAIELVRRAQAADESQDAGPGPRALAWLELRAARKAGKGRALAIELPHPDSYVETLRAWRDLRALSGLPRRRSSDDPTAPVAPPATNWIPIGPSVIRRGQATGAPPVSGRAVDVAIAPGGSRVYAATANGGVFRSDDGGASWRAVMGSLALAPTFVDSDSLACGAIAIDPSNPDRVYVGTGEGESTAFFNGVFGVVYAYAGVGPLRNDLGGDGPWITEAIASGSPSLNGQAFFQLAVSPTDAERVVGATTGGIYRREPDGVGGYHWTQTHAGNCTSVVVARTGGTTAWYAAMRGGPVLTSADGATWTTIGTGFPATARVTLAVQPTNTNTIYAFSSAGVHRLDVANGAWLPVTGAIGVDVSDYGAALAVDPTDVTRIYVGTYSVGASGDAFISRGIVSATGSGPTLAYSCALTDIGVRVHPDVHRLVVRADAAAELWVTCDGGLFRTTTATAAATFDGRNVGLASALCTYIVNHPSEAAVVFSGAQDNGTLRYTGEEAWLHSADGDGGQVVVNWNDPYKVISSYVWGKLNRATDGGVAPSSWSHVYPPSVGAATYLFYPPLAGAPQSAVPAEADRLAVGGTKVWFSDNFATSWATPDTASLNGKASALVFATANKVYAGTTTGRVYTYTRTGMTWSAGVLIGQVGGGASAGLAPIVTRIVADPADATGASFYLTLGGSGDWRRVWHYDGTAWAPRSGPSMGAATSLLAVHFNALAADPANPAQLFAGADIGIWRSTDGGANWTAYADGLPEAGVTDLMLHGTHRLLRAATYGRGVFERAIDATSAAGIELYSRDTTLDVARWPTADLLSDPESGSTPHALVLHYESPNIKVDPPASSGTYQATKNIDFYQFVDKIVDGSGGVATIDAALGTAVNRVYVEVHNRGVTQADGVQVMLLVANASAGLNVTPLPAGYAANVQGGTPISTADWQTVGVKNVDGVRVDAPKVVEFDLPSTMLPPPASLPAQAHYCLLAILHHPLDQFNNVITNADALAVADRKVAQRNLNIVNFTGTLPPADAPSTPLESMSALIDLYASGRPADLVFESDGLAGSVTLLMPRSVDVGRLKGSFVGGKVLEAGQLDDVVKRHAGVVERSLRDSRSFTPWTRSALAQLDDYLGGTAIRFARRAKSRFSGIKNAPFDKPVRALLVFEAPKGAKLGDAWKLRVMLVQPGGNVAGGASYHCQVVLPPDDERDVRIDADVRRIEGTLNGVLAVRVSSGGKDPGPKADVVAVLFTGLGMERRPKRLVWDEDIEAFVAVIERGSTDVELRRVTIVARVGKREGRKTVEYGHALLRAKVVT